MFMLLWRFKIRFNTFLPNTLFQLANFYSFVTLNLNMYI